MNTALLVIIVIASLLGSTATIITAVVAFRAHRQATENKRRLDSYDQARQIYAEAAGGAQPPPPDWRNRRKGRHLWLVPIVTALAGGIEWMRHHPYLTAGTGIGVALAATVGALLLVPALTSPSTGMRTALPSLTATSAPSSVLPLPSTPSPSATSPPVVPPPTGGQHAGSPSDGGAAPVAPVSYRPPSPSRSAPVTGTPPATTGTPPPSVSTPPTPPPPRPACLIGVHLPPPLLSLCLPPLRR